MQEPETPAANGLQDGVSGPADSESSLTIDGRSGQVEDDLLPSLADRYPRERQALREIAERLRQLSDGNFSPSPLPPLLDKLTDALVSIANDIVYDIRQGRLTLSDPTFEREPLQARGPKVSQQPYHHQGRAPQPDSCIVCASLWSQPHPCGNSFPHRRSLPVQAATSFRRPLARISRPADRILAPACVAGARRVAFKGRRHREAAMGTGLRSHDRFCVHSRVCRHAFRDTFSRRNLHVRSLCSCQWAHIISE